MEWQIDEDGAIRKECTGPTEGRDGPAPDPTRKAHGLTRFRLFGELLAAGP